jgi:hypothetical protein
LLAYGNTVLVMLVMWSQSIYLRSSASASWHITPFSWDAKYTSTTARQT